MSGSEESESFFAVLGLPVDVDDDALIRKTFYKLSRQSHPDKFLDPIEREEASKRQMNINEAFTVLKEKDTRDRYRQQLLNPRLVTAGVDSRMTIVYSVRESVHLDDKTAREKEEMMARWIRTQFLTPRKFSARRTELHTGSEVLKGEKVFTVLKVTMRWRFIVTINGHVDRTPVGQSKTAMTYDEMPFLVPISDSGGNGVARAFPSYPAAPTTTGPEADAYAERKATVGRIYAGLSCDDIDAIIHDATEDDTMEEAGTVDVNSFPVIMKILKGRFDVEQDLKRLVKETATERFTTIHPGVTVTSRSVVVDDKESDMLGLEPLQFRIPIALTQYTYKRTRYDIMVNLATGEMAGGRPYSKVKKALADAGVRVAKVGLKVGRGVASRVVGSMIEMPEEEEEATSVEEEPEE